MINQLLAGVHIASAAEAIAFTARLGLNTRLLFDFITISGGTSWYVSSAKQSCYPLNNYEVTFVFDNLLIVTFVIHFFVYYGCIHMFSL